MINRLSPRMSKVKPSATLALNALAKQMKNDGVDVVNLTAGETDFSTDELIQQAATKSIIDGNTRYTPAHGTQKIREKVGSWFSDRWKLDYKTEEITVTAGVKQGLFNLMLATVGEGDEVIIPAPYWVSYPTMVNIAGGTPVILPTKPEEGFRIDPEQLKSMLTEKTRMFILNSPNNPTGAVQSKEDLAAIAKALEGTNVLVVADEIYGELVYQSGVFCSFASLSEDAFKRTITMNGLSKSHAMTGWRVGFAAGDANIIKAMGSLMGQSVSNITSFVQDASVVALDLSSEKISKMRETMEERRDRVLEILSVNSNIKLLPPNGAFYCFPDLSFWFGAKTPNGAVINGSTDLANYLLEDALLAVVPGSAFGEDRCVRLSFATDLATLEKGLDRLLSALNSLTR